MKTLALALIGSLALAGCAQTTAVEMFTATDLANAVAIDKATNNTEKLQCDVWVQSQLMTLQAATANTPMVTGIFSASSAADGVVTSALTAVGPTQQTAFEEACAPYVLHVAGTITGLKTLASAAPGVLAAIGVK